MNKARAAGDTLLTDDRCVSGFKALCIWPMMSAIDCSKRLSRPSRWEAIIGGRAALSGVGLGLLWYARWQVGSLDWCGASSLRVLASWRAAVWWDYVLGYHRWLASALHDASLDALPSCVHGRYTLRSRAACLFEEFSPARSVPASETRRRADSSAEIECVQCARPAGAHVAST